MRKTETIAAIATAVSQSGIGIVRISGAEALDVADSIFQSRKGTRKPSQMSSHTIHYGDIYDNDELIDEVLLLIMRAPHSYTCEDVVEIDCHGGILVTRRVLETVLKHGARPAEPGEFTKRAFLNGRIDLSQAESVIDVINAKNDFALKSSVRQLHGAVLHRIQEIRPVILHEMAFIESALDDPEHYTLDGYEEELRTKLDTVLGEVSDLLLYADQGRMLKEGIQTVIVGKPNAGKSSLLNLLVGTDRAIVTEIAGTTRDVLEEQIQLGEISLNLIDTAGIRETQDVVERIGVNKSREAILRADLVIYVVDASTPLDESDREIMSLIQEKKVVVLLNKSDLTLCVTPQMIGETLKHPMISFSALEGIGVDALRECIRDLFFTGSIGFNDEVYITNARHKAALAEARKSLAMVLESMDNQMPEDFLTIDLMNAYEALGSIIGESVDDDLIDAIFRDFCMGK